MSGSHPEIGLLKRPLAAFVSQTFLTFDDFKESCQIFHRMSLTWDLSDVFLMNQLSYGFGG